MADDLSPDICVIGGGPGGLAAALRAAEEGVEVVLVNDGPLGGAYIHGGGLASKALLAAGEARERLRRGPTMGVTGAPLQVNLAKVREHATGAIDAALAPLSVERLSALGIVVVEGSAVFADNRTVTVGEQKIAARRFILATGATPALPDIEGLADVPHVTVDAAFDLGKKPNHLLVLGAGAHGLELAQAFTRLGIDTTVVDPGAALPEFDTDHRDIVLERLEAEGVRVRAGLDIEGVSKRRGGIRFRVKEGDAIANVDGTQLVVAGHRQPNLDGLALAAAGIETGPDGVIVDAQLRTTNRRVYAIGDLLGAPYSAARARHQAHFVIRGIMFRWPAGYEARAAVRALHTDPAIAEVGLDEPSARARSGAIQVLRFPLNETAQAHLESAPHGVVKAIAAPNGTVLGASVIARNATDLIAPWSLAVARRLPITAMADLSVAEPSLSEAAPRAAALAARADLTPRWRQTIIGLLRKLG